MAIVNTYRFQTEGERVVENSLVNINNLLIQLTGQIEGTNNRLSNMGAQLGSLNANMAKTTDKTNKVTQQTSMWQKSLKSVAVRLVGLHALLSIGLGKLRELWSWVQNSGEAFRKFERRLAEVSTIIKQLGGTEMPQMTAQIEMLSKRFGKNVEDLSKGMYDILSASFEASEGMRLLRTATVASIAGLTDVEKAVDSLTSILNAYGKNVGQASAVSDELFQTVIRGKLVFEDLASAMGYIVPIAANLGVEMRELLASFSTATRQGQHLDMVTRGLALGLQDISDPTVASAKAAKEYGVDLNSTALQVKGLEYVLYDLNEAMNEYGAKILPEMIRNMRSMRVFMALTGKEGIQGFTRDLNELNTEAGQTEEAFTKMANTMAFQVDVLDQTMAQLERRVGEVFTGFEIWWKKTQVWWGTLFTAGLFEAEKSVRKIDEYIIQLQRHYISLVAQQGQGITPFFKQFEMGRKQELPVDEVIEYFRVQDQMYKKAKDWIDVENELRIAKLEKSEAGGDRPAAWFDEDWSRASESVTKLESKLGGLREEYEMLTIEADTLVWSFNYLEGAMGDFTEAIDSNKLNIITLNNEIDRLDEQVRKTYTAFSGQQFGWDEGGYMGWQKAVLEQETALDRVNNAYRMASAYGGEYLDELYELNPELAALAKIIYEAADAQEELNKQTGKRFTFEAGRISTRRILEELRNKKTSKGEKTEAEQAEEDAQRILDVWSYRNYKLSDIRDDEIRNLEEMIIAEQTELLKYESWLREEWATYGKTVGGYINFLKQIDTLGLTEQYEAITGLNVVREANRQYRLFSDFISQNHGNDFFKALSIFRSALPGGWTPFGGSWPGGFQHGTTYVPKTGLYPLHKGEEVIPAGGHGGQTTIQVNIPPIEINARIVNDDDMEAFITRLGYAVSTGLVSGLQTNYRVG